MKTENHRTCYCLSALAGRSKQAGPIKMSQLVNILHIYSRNQCFCFEMRSHHISGGSKNPCLIYSVQSGRRKGTDPFTKWAETKEAIPNIARRPFFNSRN